MKYGLFIAVFMVFYTSLLIGMDSTNSISFDCIADKSLLSEYKELFEGLFKGHYISYFYHLHYRVNEGNYVVLYHNHSDQTTFNVPYLAIKLGGSDKGAVYKSKDGDYNTALYYKKNNEELADKWRAIVTTTKKQ